ncbi:hypothetical protein Tco_1180427, partial [Tanacetum coccineum]
MSANWYSVLTILNKVGSIVPLEKPLDIRKFDSSSYQALGACFNPYKAFLSRLFLDDLDQQTLLAEQHKPPPSVDH